MDHGGDLLVAFIRTFGNLQPSKDVVGVNVRVRAEGPAKITDVQLVPGSSLFQWSPMVGDLQLRASRNWRFINGMVQRDYDTWVMADEDLASPYRGMIWPRGLQQVEWGLMPFGQISSRVDFNGYDYTLSTGAGVTPHLTARADQRLDLRTSGILSATVAIRGIHEDPGAPPAREDLGTVTESHSEGWPAVWGWHEDWAAVLADHGGW